MQVHDCIVVLEDLQEFGIRAGGLGTVVHVHPTQDAYQVEFVSLTGKTVGVATLAATKVRAGSGSEIAHARTLAA